MAANLPPSLLNVDPGLRLGDIFSISDALNDLTGAASHLVTASTTQTQLGGTQLATAITRVGTANASDAVTMPQANPGQRLIIINTSGQTIQLFPAVGETINAASKNASVTIGNNTISIYVSSIKQLWFGGAIAFET